MKRVLVISDLHSGHRAGLTPPKYQLHEERQFSLLQSTVWDFYTRTIDILRPIDVLIVCGDAVDGKGERSGGTELIETSMEIQSDMAAECIEYVHADNIFMVYGTPYHVGAEDWESSVADKVGATIKSHLWLDINGLVFDIKHKVGSSGIPHGRYTAMAREKLWNTLWAERDLQPSANIFLRGHVHYHIWAGEPGKEMITCPALQGHGSKFGERQCAGIIHTGLLHFDIESKEDYSWRSHILASRVLAEEAIKL